MNKSNEARSIVERGEPDWFERYGIRHIAIIPDGNRRWARERSLQAKAGHTQGLLGVLPPLVHSLCNAGVHTVTVWGFSTENWTRETAEVDHLMAIGVVFLRHHLLEIARTHDARVYHLGRKDRLYPELREALIDVQELTAKNRSKVYNVALDYGGQDELVRAGERLVKASRENTTSGKELLITDFLDTAGQPHPNPDIVIRTSGEQRVSGFLPLQTIYSELFFLDALFPDVTFELVREVAEQFRSRKRRFGG